MSRTPKDVAVGGDGFIECHPHEPDDKGGGFPCVYIETTIYNEKQLNQVIRELERKRKWIAWESEGKYK